MTNDTQAKTDATTGNDTIADQTKIFVEDMAKSVIGRAEKVLDDNTKEAVNKAVAEKAGEIREQISVKTAEVQTSFTDSLSAGFASVRSLFAPAEGEKNIAIRAGKYAYDTVKGISDTLTDLTNLSYLKEKFNDFDNWSQANTESFSDKMSKNMELFTGDDEKTSIFDRLFAGIKCIFHFICFAFTKIISTITGAINGGAPVSSDDSKKAGDGENKPANAEEFAEGKAEQDAAKAAQANAVDQDNAADKENGNPQEKEPAPKP